MVKLIVAYGEPEDTAAFDDYYVNKHVPIASKIPDVRRFEAGKVLGSPDGSAAPYYFMATIWFDDVDSLQSAMGSPEGQAAGADIPNFSPNGATMMIAEA